MISRAMAKGSGIFFFENAHPHVTCDLSQRHSAFVIVPRGNGIEIEKGIRKGILEIRRIYPIETPRDNTFLFGGAVRA